MSKVERYNWKQNLENIGTKYVIPAALIAGAVYKGYNRRLNHQDIGEFEMIEKPIRGEGIKDTLKQAAKIAGTSLVVGSLAFTALNLLNENKQGQVSYKDVFNHDAFYKNENYDEDVYGEGITDTLKNGAKRVGQALKTGVNVIMGASTLTLFALIYLTRTGFFERITHNSQRWQVPIGDVMRDFRIINNKLVHIDRDGNHYPVSDLSELGTLTQNLFRQSGRGIKDDAVNFVKKHKNKVLYPALAYGTYKLLNAPLIGGGWKKNLAIGASALTGVAMAMLYSVGESDLIHVRNLVSGLEKKPKWELF